MRIPTNLLALWYMGCGREKGHHLRGSRASDDFQRRLIENSKTFTGEVQMLGDLGGTDPEFQRSWYKDSGDLGMDGRLGQTRLEMHSRGGQASGGVGMIWSLVFKDKLR